MQLTNCLCTYISVSDCTDLTQAACYWTHKAIAHETFHTTQIIHTVQRYIHTYLQTYIVIHVFIIKIIKSRQNDWYTDQNTSPSEKNWGKANITEAAKVLFTIFTWPSKCKSQYKNH